MENLVLILDKTDWVYSDEYGPGSGYGDGDGYGDGYGDGRR